jgi:hypothetical protein
MSWAVGMFFLFFTFNYFITNNFLIVYCWRQRWWQDDEVSPNGRRQAKLEDDGARPKWQEEGKIERPKTHQMMCLGPLVCFFFYFLFNYFITNDFFLLLVFCWRWQWQDNEGRPKWQEAGQHDDKAIVYCWQHWWQDNKARPKWQEAGGDNKKIIEGPKRHPTGCLLDCVLFFSHLTILLLTYFIYDITSSK